MSRTLAVLVLSLFLPAAWGADVRSVDVHEQDGRYTVNFDALIDVPVDEALRLMLTPGLWPQLSPIITDAKVVAEGERVPRRVEITFYDCVFIFCKTVHKTEDITVGADGHIESLALPEQSDFSYAKEEWHIFSVDDRTHIEYRSEMVPSFFVPPVIGPFILKARLRNMLTHTATNLEKLARAAVRTEAPAPR